MLSGAFIVFVLTVFIAYYVVPGRAQAYLLSGAGLVFCAVHSPVGTAALLFEALVAFLFSRSFSKGGAARKRFVFALCLLFYIASAVAIKYLTPAAEGASLIDTFELSKLSYVFGASYFLLRLISYTADVFTGKTAHSGDYFKLVLYLCYFPAVVEGPVERFGTFTEKAFTAEKKKISYDIVRSSGQSILRGLFKLYVIGGYAGRYISNISDPSGKTPLLLIYSLVMYSVYIYADFSGGIDLFRGISYLFGIELDENFKAPYFSQNIKQFWQRWHMTFGAWLRDYVYIPLGGNRRGAVRKALNVIAVFTVSALWHGVTPAFLVWGLVHALYQITGDLIRKGRASEKRAPLPVYLLRSARTFALVSFSWLFFSLEKLSGAFDWLVGVFTFRAQSLSSAVTSGLREIFEFDSFGYVGIVYFSLVVLYFLFEMLGDRYNFSLFSREKTRIGVRWTVYAVMLFCVIALGFYGEGYDAGSFLYGGF